MVEQTVTCPECGTVFPLGDAFQDHIDKETERRLEQVRRADKKEHERAVTRAREEGADQVREEYRQEMKERDELEYRLGRKEKELEELEENRKRDVQRAREEAAEELQRNFARQLEEVDKARDKAEKALADKDEEHELAINRAREEANEEAENKYRLGLQGKDEEIRRMGDQLAAMERRTRQGSMELQGEALEVWLKKEIQLNFPQDQVDDVQRGQTGADLVQRVFNPMGKRSGIIVWEAKNTKNWNAGWLSKARQDAERVGNALPVIVSVTLPEGVRTAECIDGVWVCSMECALVVGHLLRQQLLETSDLQRAMEGHEGKMANVYAYVISDGFRGHMERIIDTWIELSQQIDTEERAMNAQWKVRRRQLERVLNLTSDMHAEIKAIVGAELPQVEGMKLEALPSGEQD